MLRQAFPVKPRRALGRRSVRLDAGGSVNCLSSSQIPGNSPPCRRRPLCDSGPVKPNRACDEPTQDKSKRPPLRTPSRFHPLFSQSPVPESPSPCLLVPLFPAGAPAGDSSPIGWLVPFFLVFSVPPSVTKTKQLSYKHLYRTFGDGLSFRGPELQRIGEIAS